MPAGTPAIRWLFNLVFRHSSGTSLQHGETVKSVGAGEE
jgi:hypothetical protein